MLLATKKKHQENVLPNTASLHPDYSNQIKIGNSKQFRTRGKESGLGPLGPALSTWEY